MHGNPLYPFFRARETTPAPLSRARETTPPSLSRARERVRVRAPQLPHPDPLPLRWARGAEERPLPQSLQHAAVYGNRAASDVTGAGRGEEDDHIGEFVG